MRTSARWGVAGHSQGGQAALAAAELAASYGEELSLRATVAVAPAVELATITAMSAADALAWPYAGYTAWGIKAVCPGFDFARFCGPRLLPIVERAGELPCDEWWDLCLGARLDDGDSDRGAAVVAYLKATEVGSARASGAVMILQGSDDLFMATLDTLLGKLEAQGDDVHAVVMADRDHDAALLSGWPQAQEFFEERLPLR